MVSKWGKVGALFSTLGGLAILWVVLFWDFVVQEEDYICAYCNAESTHEVLYYGASQIGEKRREVTSVILREQFLIDFPEITCYHAWHMGEDKSRKVLWESPLGSSFGLDQSKVHTMIHVSPIWNTLRQMYSNDSVFRTEIKESLETGLLHRERWIELVQEYDGIRLEDIKPHLLENRELDKERILKSSANQDGFVSFYQRLDLSNVGEAHLLAAVLQYMLQE